MSKRIVVVGASRGIGKALVTNFAKDPTNEILALARNEVAMQDLAIFSNVNCRVVDLNSGNVRAEMEAIFTDFGSIDILINNAGYLVKKDFVDLTAEDLISSYQVNVIGVMQTVQAAVSLMQENGGHIVNISSMGGFQSSMKFAGLSAYSTSKAAVVSFTELFAEEFKETAIKMNCLCLGSVQTEMLEEAFPGYEAPLSPAEMANYICDFALHAHKYMHGKIIPVSLTNP